MGHSVENNGDKRMNEKTYEIKQKDIEGLIRYLQQRPYIEVFQGISLLTNLKEISIEKKEVKPEK